ncbi:hypothetical protein F0562_027384 [Nyssa sinensis]|uniref:Uncharacterized protein n=1 Tax=Nyssa sinensis TaxID=561372 RepID=A0A5J5B6W2_9ASTE|nr:hypothetical protein F0562_027384 [Nyssa sinensis]
MFWLGWLVVTDGGGLVMMEFRLGDGGSDLEVWLGLWSAVAMTGGGGDGGLVLWGSTFMMEGAVDRALMGRLWLWWLLWSVMEMGGMAATVVLRRDREGRWRDLVMVEMSAVEVLDGAAVMRDELGSGWRGGGGTGCGGSVIMEVRWSSAVEWWLLVRRWRCEREVGVRRERCSGGDGRRGGDGRLWLWSAMMEMMVMVVW